MNYRIEKKDAFRIVGAKKHFELNVDENAKEIPLFWGEVFQNGMFPRISALSNREPAGVLGVCSCMNGKDFDYFIASATDEKTPEDMSEFIVPEATWAIFESIGAVPQAIQELQKRVITEWLPTSGYEYADAPDLEVYPPGDANASDYKFEVWLPVRKK